MKYLKKSIPFHMLLLAGMLPVVSTMTAAEKSSAPDNAPVAPLAKVVPFLGIETLPVDAATRARLKLSEETGLRVRFIAPQSPAATTLQAGDVLVRLDDQILCNHNQLRALIRSKKPKDTVTVNLFRDGHAMDVKVTLGQVTVDDKVTEHDAPHGLFFEPDRHFRLNETKEKIREILREKMSPERAKELRDMLREQLPTGPGGIITLDPDVFKDIPEEAREILREMRETSRRRFEEFQQKWNAPSPALSGGAKNEKPSPVRSTMRIEITDEDGNPANFSVTAPEKKSPSPAKSTVTQKRISLHDGAVSASTVIRDGDGSVTLTTREGSREVVIKDKDGKVTFEGPVNTDDERAAMPPPARKRLEMLEQLSGGVSVNLEQ